MFHIFILFFFGIAPVVQYKNKLKFWDSRPLTHEEYLLAGFLVLVALVIYEIVYLNTRKSKTIQKKRITCRYPNKGVSYKRLFFLVGLSIINLFIVFRSKSYNILLLLFRDLAIIPEDLIWNGSQTEWLLTEYFVRPTNLVIFVLYTYFFPTDKKKWYFLLIGIITMSPLATARFATAAIYIPIVLVLIKKIWRRYYFTFLICFALLFVWPFLNIFRNFDAEADISFTMNNDVFKAMDMDAFHNFANVLKHDVVTFGHQLIGNVFFFVPRSLWEDKPVGSSVVLAKACGFSFENVSCCYFAEGFINFGYMGIFLFTYIIAYLCAKIDKAYWKINRKVKNLSSCYYLICLGFLFFILRGDMLSSVSYLIGFTLSFLLASVTMGLIKPGNVRNVLTNMV